MRKAGLAVVLGGVSMGVVAAWAEPAAPPFPPPRPSLPETAVTGRRAPLPPPARPARSVGPVKAVFGPPLPPHAGPLQPGPPASAPVSPAPLALNPLAPAPFAPTPPSGGVPLDEELVCVRLFNGGHVEARAVTSVAPANDGCGIAAPVEVSAILAEGKRRIPLQPPVLVNCAMADALATWVRDDLVPAFAATSRTLVGLRSTSGYACRGRNNVANAKVSEHGRGNAVDIGGFEVAGGPALMVDQRGAAALGVVRATACGRFATVLGPGSDGYHETHMHVDLEPRRHGSKICHWDMP